MTETFSIDDTFVHRYRAEHLTELPASFLNRFYFPGASREGGQNGLIMRVESETSGSWVGMFAFGINHARGAVSGILSMPDADQLCVVAKGAGYLVSASAPTEWATVQSEPILDVRQVAAKRLVVFANFTELCAYDATGLRWRTERLAWDGFHITEMDDNTLIGKTWDLSKDAEVSFAVDLATGNHQGGIRSF